MICRECRIACFDLLDGTICPKLEAKVRLHLETCADCRLFLAQEKGRLEGWPKLVSEQLPDSSFFTSEQNIRRILHGNTAPESEKVPRRASFWQRLGQLHKIVAILVIATMLSIFSWASIKIATAFFSHSADPSEPVEEVENLSLAAESESAELDTPLVDVEPGEPGASHERGRFASGPEFKSDGCGEAVPNDQTSPEGILPMKMNRVVTAGSVAALIAATSANAAIFTGVSGNDWSQPLSWSTGLVPDANEDAIIGTTAAAGALDPAVQLNAGATGTAKSLTIGQEAGAGGSLTVNNTTLELLTGDSFIGKSGEGTLTVTNNAQLNGGKITVGSVKNAKGELVIANGASFNPGNNVVIAAAGSGSLLVSGGSLNSAVWGLTGASTVGGQAEILFDEEAQITLKNILLAGWGVNSSAELTVDGNSTVDVLETLTLGNSVGSSGAVVFKSGTWIQKGISYVGNKKGASGSLHFQGSGFLPLNQVWLASEAGSSGSIEVTGTSLLWTNNIATVYVGHSGEGQFDVVDSSLTIRPALLYIGNAATASGTFNMSGSDVTNQTTIIGSTAGSSGKITQTGGSLTVNDYFRVAANGTGGYLSSDGIFNGRWVEIAAYSSGTTVVGTVELSGTERAFNVSGSLAIGTQGSGGLTNRVAQLAGGIDLAASTTLTVGNTGNIHIQFEEDPVETGMYWGLRWTGDHVADLIALSETIPAKLSWDVEGVNPYYRPDVGIHYDGDFTYVGIPIIKFATNPTLIIIN